MAGTEQRAFQFSIRQLLIATAWIAFGLAVWKAVSPIDHERFFDDDPDNVWPRWVVAFALVPLAGAVGALRGRPIAYALWAFLFWLVACAAILAIGLMRLF